MIESKTRVYYAIRNALSIPSVRYVDSAGGTRSSKTFSALQVLIEIAKGCSGLIISVVSETFPHLKRGAIRDFKVILADEWDEAAWNKSESIYTFPSGSIIEFFSADQPGKVHGPARDILFINEANHIAYETARQLFVRTRLFVLYDYNPTHSFWAHEQIAPRNNCVCIHSTYKDNDYLTPEQVAEIESNRNDANWWRVYGEGKVGQLEGLIFPDFELVDEMPPVQGGLREVYGMDFGFTNDPSALLRILIDTGKKVIYADEVFYATGMLNSAMAAAMEEAGVPKRSTMIFADCAEPKTIAELGGYGYNILPCYKATRKAEQLQMMKGYRLQVTKRSLNTIRELRNYCWMQDKDGRWLNEPQPFGDHCFTADTLVLTQRGNIPIVDVRMGDMVATSRGWNKVLRTFKNGYKEILCLSLFFGKFRVELRCTPDHLIKTEKGWKQAQELTEKDIVFLALNLAGESMQNTKARGITLAGERNCIKRYGNTITEKSQKGAIFTTKISTQIITKLKTLFALLNRNTQRYTQNKNGERGVAKSNCNTLLKSANLQRRGTQAKKGGLGTGNTQRICNPANIILSASIAERNISAIGRAKSIAPIIASQQQDGQAALILSCGIAKDAAQNLQPINIAGQGFAIPAVVKRLVKEDAGVAEVFDIEVENAHEFFANGVLVHNCMDAMRYGVVTYLTQYAMAGQYNISII